MDSGQLAEVEYQRVMRLQEMFPNADFAVLYKSASPHLKSETSFNRYLNELMERKLKDDSEDEEERHLKDSLNFAFTNKIENDAFNQCFQKFSESTDSHKKTTKKLLDTFPNAETCKLKLSKVEHDCAKNQKKCISRAALWDNMEDLNDLNAELDKILEGEIEYGDRSHPKENIEERGESAVGRDSDSDESFHSLEGDHENKNFSPEKPIRQNSEKKIENTEEKNALYNKPTGFSEYQIRARIERLENESKENSSCLLKPKKEGDGLLNVLPESFQNKLKFFSEGKEVKKEIDEEEKNSFCRESENKKNFAFINGLILKKKDETVEKPKEIVPEKTDVLPDSVPPKEVDQSKLIDYFFYTTAGIKEEKKDSGVSKYEKQGAIPKRKPKVESEIRQTVSEQSVQVYRTEAAIPNFGEGPIGEEISRSLDKKKEASEENSESKVPEIHDLKVPGYPFVYVVAESYSPNFRLPKGNYLITNQMDEVNKVGNTFAVLLHPTDKLEFREKKSEPEPDSNKKTNGFKTEVEIEPVFNFGTGLKSRNVEKFNDSTSRSNFSVGNKYDQPFKSEPLNFQKSYAQMTSSGLTFGNRFEQGAKMERPKIVPPKKGKIFCNTPLQSLKKEAEDRNDSADAYGAILQSVADDFKSCTNNNRPEKNVSSKDQDVFTESPSTTKLNRSAPDNSPMTRFDFQKPENPDEDEMGEKEDDFASDEEKVDEEEEDQDDDDDVSAQDRMSSLLKALKNSDPEFLKRKLEKCGDNAELKRKVIDEEVQRNIQSDKETKKLNDGYLKILEELPELDPEYVLAKWSDLVGDDSAIKVFVQSEKLKIQLKEVKNRLVSNLPLLDRDFLEGKAKDFLYDSEGLESFIQEEKKKMIIDQNFQDMMNRLPGVDPALLRQKADEFEGDATLVKEFIETKKLELKELEEKNYMLSILQDADPVFLDEKYQEYKANPGALENLLFQLLESKEYPKIKEEDPASRARSELWRRFVDHFDVKDFLNKTPNPEEHFCGIKGDNNKTDMGFITKFLQSRYPDTTVQELEKTFREKKSNLTNACAQLDTKLRPVEMMDVSFKMENIPESFLLEMVFILHRREIRDYVREERDLRQYMVESARKHNALLACACCFEDELLETDVTTCADGHIFCIECVRRSVETKLSDGDTKYGCLTSDCATEFTLAILEKILPSDLYGKVLKKRQAAEVTEAKVPGLESCPSCDFAYIPNQNDKIFKCQNSDCLRETCRLCKEESHVPKRCNEVERPKDTEVRRKIEEKMTEALVRACPKCGKKFVKTDGCNKMTCVCGAASCYLCRKLVTDYSHFNGQGGDKHHLCPLFSNNEELHVGEVRRVGQNAVNQALRENPDLHLVHDPTKTI